MHCLVSIIDELKMEHYPCAIVVKSVMHDMISTRPDLTFVMSVLSRFMANPGIDHWMAVKWVVSYIVVTLNVGLCYEKNDASLELLDFVDSDFAGDKDTKKLPQHIFTPLKKFVHPENQVCNSLLLSTTESKYVTVTECHKEGI